MPIRETTRAKLVKFLKNELSEPVTKTEVSRTLGITLPILDELLQEYTEAKLVRIVRMGRYTFVVPFDYKVK